MAVFDALDLAELDEGEIRMFNFFRMNDGKTFGKGEVVEKLGIYPRTAERELKHLVVLSERGDLEHLYGRRGIRGGGW